MKNAKRNWMGSPLRNLRRRQINVLEFQIRAGKNIEYPRSSNQHISNWSFDLVLNSILFLHELMKERTQTWLWTMCMVPCNLYHSYSLSSCSIMPSPSLHRVVLVELVSFIQMKMSYFSKFYGSIYCSKWNKL